MLESAGFDVIASRTLIDTVTAPEDHATREFLSAQFRATAGNLADFAGDADAQALAAIVDQRHDARWEGATVTLSRSLLIARPRTVQR